VRPAVKVARIVGASRHSRLETEPRYRQPLGVSRDKGVDFVPTFDEMCGKRQVKLSNMWSSKTQLQVLKLAEIGFKIRESFSQEKN